MPPRRRRPPGPRWRPPPLRQLLAALALALLLALPVALLLRHGPGRLAPVAPGPASAPAIPTAGVGPVPVRVLMPAPFADATAPLVRAYNARQGAIQLEVSRGPLDTEAVSDQAIGSLLLGDTPYDLLLMDVTWTARYAAAGWLAPLEPLLGADALEPFLPAARAGNAFDGHLWRLPLMADMGLLYWRTDLMERPPRTPAELEAISTALQRSGRVRWGYLWQGRQYEGLSCVLLEAFAAFGGHWLDPADGRLALTSPAAVRAVAWLDHLVRAGISPAAVAGWSENEALQSFAAGEAALLRNWPYAWALLQQPGSAVAGRVGVTTVVGPPGAAAGSGTLGSWGFALLRGSAHPEAAADVIRWFAGPEVQRTLALGQGYSPSLAALYAEPELQARQPLLAVQRRALAAAVARPITPLYAQLSDVLQRQVNGLLSQGGDPGSGAAAAAMARAQRGSEAVLRAAGAALP